GPFNFLAPARLCGPAPFFLFLSTNKVYGDLGLDAPEGGASRYSYPGHEGVNESQALDFHSPYGCSKGAADQYVRDFARIYGLPPVLFRISCVRVPRQLGTQASGA